MTCSALRNRSLWKTKMQDAAFRSLIRAQMAQVLAELPDGRISMAEEMKEALQANLTRQRGRISQINSELDRISGIYVKLSGDVDPELTGLALSCVERSDALTDEKAELVKSTEGGRVQGEIARLEATMVEMQCQKDNALFLLGIAEEVEKVSSRVSSRDVENTCPAPVPTKIVADRGRASVANSVIIEGRFFLEGITGDVGGKALLNIVVQSMTMMTASVPPGVPLGRQRLTVMNVDGKSGQLENAWLAY